MAKKISEELAELTKDDVIAPTINGIMNYSENESLMFFGYSKHKGKLFRLFYGIGIVYRVVKGEKQDLIYINFGMFKEHNRRVVVAYENHARRQTLTLKRGQVCQVYGICRPYLTEFDDIATGEHKKRVRLGLFAKAFSAWYVPTMLDIKRLPTNDDLVEMSEKEKDLANTFDDVLDEFLNTKGDED